MIERRPTRWNAAVSTVSAAMLPSFVVGAGVAATTYWLLDQLSLPQTVPAAVLIGLSGVVMSVVAFALRDYLAYRNAETRVEREARERELLLVLQRRYPDTRT